MSQNAELHNTTMASYGEKPEKSGLYLGLFHGRNHPNEKMNGWGFTGPSIGPLRWCHTTYALDIKIEFENASDALAYFGKEGPQFELAVDGDMLVFEGKYYGDWTVYYISPSDCERPPDSFRESRRVNRFAAHQRLCF
jgi:hypothetical protein